MAEGDEIYEVVEEQPQFPGGMQAMYKWMGDNLRYPGISPKDGVQGKVLIRFVVSKTGQITDPKVLKSLDPYTDKEAVRLVSSMPKWNPGKIGGAPVKSYFVLPVTFRQN